MAKEFKKPTENPEFIIINERFLIIETLLGEILNKLDVIEEALEKPHKELKDKEDLEAYRKAMSNKHRFTKDLRGI